MADYGLRVYTSGGEVAFSEQDTTLRLVSGFSVASSSNGSRSITGVTSSNAVAVFNATSFIGTQARVWITNGKVNWSKVSFDGSGGWFRILVFRRD